MALASLCDNSETARRTTAKFLHVDAYRACVTHWAGSNVDMGHHLVENLLFKNYGYALYSNKWAGECTNCVWSHVCSMSWRVVCTCRCVAVIVCHTAVRVTSTLTTANTQEMLAFFTPVYVYQVSLRMYHIAVAMTIYKNLRYKCFL